MAFIVKFKWESAPDQIIHLNNKDHAYKLAESLQATFGKEFDFQAKVMELKEETEMLYLFKEKYRVENNQPE